MNKNKKLGMFTYILGKYKIRLFLIFFMSLILIGLFIFQVIKPSLWDTAEKVISIVTLSVAIFVSYQQGKEEWLREYLTKRFSGEFYFNDKKVIEFKNALLPNEGDIRALAQQIAKQMVNGNISFVAPEVKVEGPNVNKKEKYIHYKITFYLLELPKDVDEDETLTWKSPFIEKQKINIKKSTEKNAN